MAGRTIGRIKARLIQIRKIWGVEIAVLNEELAGEYKLTCYDPYVEQLQKFIRNVKGSREMEERFMIFAESWNGS